MPNIILWADGCIRPVVDLYLICLKDLVYYTNYQYGANISQTSEPSAAEKCSGQHQANKAATLAYEPSASEKRSVHRQAKKAANLAPNLRLKRYRCCRMCFLPPSHGSRPPPLCLLIK